MFMLPVLRREIMQTGYKPCKNIENTYRIIPGRTLRPTSHSRKDLSR